MIGLSLNAKKYVQCRVGYDIPSSIGWSYDEDAHCWPRGPAPAVAVAATVVGSDGKRLGEKSRGSGGASGGGGTDG